MHSALLPSSPRKQRFESPQHGAVLPLPLRDMEAKQHQIKSLKSYPETGGRSLAAAAGGEGGGHRVASAEMDMEANIQKAIDFKVEGHRCYKEKKFREAIGKYHRALLQLKGVHVVDGTTGSEVNLLSQASTKMTEEQRRAVDITEIECYDSLTGERHGLGPRTSRSGIWRSRALTSRILEVSALPEIQNLSAPSGGAEPRGLGSFRGAERS
ncbi:unnamed protein product [Boreogadus saida]